jgi:hypothetical protein
MLQKKVVLMSSLFALVSFVIAPPVHAASFSYTFNTPGTLYEAASAGESTSPYLWLKRGAELIIGSNVGQTLTGALAANDPWHKTYASLFPTPSDSGAHPQNMFALFSKATMGNGAASIYLKRNADNLANATNRSPYVGESILARYQSDQTYYLASIRADGYAVIKRKANGTYTTLAQAKVFSGTYDPVTNYDLIPKNTWIGLKFDVEDVAGATKLVLSTDVGQTGSWKQVASYTDTSGSRITAAGPVGVQSDYADASLDSFTISDASGGDGGGSYDSVVLGDKPVLYLAMNSSSSGGEKDLSGHNANGTYKGGTPSAAALPNGDTAADFNGTSQYLTVPSNSTLSIPAAHQLTYEAWVRPDTYSFSNESGDGYVDWMGKCENYSPNCEWEARVYGDGTSQGRDHRFSGYAFNPSAGLGSAADWQPSTSSVLPAGHWVHVVVEYDTTSTPSRL